MSVLAGYLALGTIDPTSGAFTEASYDTYARQAVTFDIAPAGNGSVDVNSGVLANSNAPVFPNPSVLDWPSLNAYAVFSAATGGQPVLYTSLGGRSGVHTRGTTRTFRAGTLGLTVKDGILTSALGGWVTSASPVALVGGVLKIGFLSQDALPAQAAPIILRALHPYTFDLIGDSRAANLFITGRGKTAYNFFNVANALLGQRMRLGLNLGFSGYRPDQYIAANLAAALASPAAWLIFGFPCVNALAAVPTGGVFPYTDVNGQTVTLATVGQCAANDIIGAALKALAIGKKVILTAEPGATNLTAAAVAQLHEFNLRLRAFAEVTPGVFMWSANSVLWNPTGSSSTITFRTGITLDGTTHFNAQGGYLAGKQFAKFIGPLLGGVSFVGGLAKVGDGGMDFAIASINDVTANNPRQLGQNPLFNTLTGGATAGSGSLSSGSVPSGWTAKLPLATTSCAVTSAANADGFGNDVTFALSTTAADTVALQMNAPASSTWTLADVLEAGVDVDVAAGSSNAGVYMDFLIDATKAGADVGAHCYDMYTTVAGPTEAYSYRFRSEPWAVANNSPDAKAFIQLIVYVVFPAAGSINLTLRRAFINRRFSYAAASGFVG